MGLKETPEATKTEPSEAMRFMQKNNSGQAFRQRWAMSGISAQANICDRNTLKLWDVKEPNNPQRSSKKTSENTTKAAKRHPKVIPNDSFWGSRKHLGTATLSKGVTLTKFVPSSSPKETHLRLNGDPEIQQIHKIQRKMNWK